MTRARRTSKELIKGDRFAVLFGGERVFESGSLGACLSCLQGKVDRSNNGDAAGTVVYEPLIGPGATVYIVARKERTTFTQIVNDIT